MKSGREQGFALLEAIVAVTILSASLVPIYMLMSTSLFSAHRLAEVNRHAEAEASALEVIRAVNPMLQSDGKITAGRLSVSWHAVAVTNPMDGTNYPRGIGLYKVGLYDTEVWARDDQGEELAHFSLQLAGYQKVRDLMAPFTAPRT